MGQVHVLIAAAATDAGPPETAFVLLDGRLPSNRANK
jgi:hypothetical protein